MWGLAVQLPFWRDLGWLRQCIRNGLPDVPSYPTRFCGSNTLEGENVLGIGALVDGREPELTLGFITL